MLHPATIAARPGATRQRLAHIAGMLGLLMAGWWLAAAPASAQLHRCVIDGRTTFSDRPCPGAAVEVRPSEAVGAPAGSSPAAGAPAAGARAPGTPAGGPPATSAPAAGGPAAGTPAAVAPPAAPRPGPATAGDADLARRCAAGDAAACRTQQTLQRHQRDMDELARHCTGGSARACDAVACVKSNDRAACARLEGRAASPAPAAVPSAGGAGASPAAARWHEESRRVETRPGRRLDGGATADRFTVVSIRCGHGGLGQVEVGNGGARIGGQGPRYDSLDEAAARMCDRAP